MRKRKERCPYGFVIPEMKNKNLQKIFQSINDYIVEKNNPPKVGIECGLIEEAEYIGGLFERRKNESGNLA